MTTIDFNKLMQDAGDGFQAIPDGAYHIEVAKATAETTKTNKPMIRVQLRVIGGPHAGRLVFDQFVISADSPNALGFFFEHMAAFGLGRDFFAANPPMETVAASLLNRQALIMVSTRTEGQYAGRNEVKKYNPPPMGQVGGTITIAQTAAPVVPQMSEVPVPQAPVPQAPVAPQAPTPPPVPVAQPPAPAPPAPAPVAPSPAPQEIPPIPAGVVPPQAVPAAAVAPASVPAAVPPVPVYNAGDEEPY